MASFRRARRTVAAGAFTTFCWITAVIALFALAAIFWSLLTQGFGGLNLAVFTQSTPAPGSPGGLMNAIVGSIILCALGMVIAVIVGVLAGTWLAEYGRNTPYAEAVRFVNDILLSAPSVLVGLFVYDVMVAHVIGHFSAIAGAVALALIAVPIITRTTEDVLKLQPTALRESGVALGTPHWMAIRKILWKSAGSGILTGGLLAFARISGETAPLLFTSFGNQFFSLDPLRPMASLPQVIFNFALSAYDDWVRLAWVGALILAGAVLAANIIARILTREPRRS
ncbi:MAG: phosphate ABC transporter permease PstA [Caulobacteraceae bacterium]|nr:phosphate ABC transporter permease PstA [Caulobacteraceae bacterium]